MADICWREDQVSKIRTIFKINDCIVSIIPIQDISESCLHSADVIISKVFSSDSIHIMTLCRTFGVKIGVDLFDDYFSDNRLVFSEDFTIGLN